MREFREIVKHAMKQRWLTQDAVRSLAGKANHIANVLYSWRPFLSELWGALNAKNKATAPGGSIWLKQIAPALKWMKCFMSGHSGSLARQWFFQDLLFQGVEYSIILDASPWGLGGILMKDGVIIRWFSSRLTKHDERQFHHKIGQADGQQVWETLCLVVALRLWLPRWKNKRVKIAVKSDNMTALTAAAKLKCATSPLLGRELSMIYTSSSFEPAIVEHLPGAMNDMADNLSRLDEPGSGRTLPLALANIPRATVPVRTPSYFLTLAA